MSTNLAGVIGFTIMMGTYYGSAYSLLTTLTISIVGLPALAFAFGVEMICAGLGYLVAPPLAGGGRVGWMRVCVCGGGVGRGAGEGECVCVWRGSGR